MFTLAVYALPLVIGVTAGVWAHDSGAGMVGGLAIGVVAAGSTAVHGQLVFVFVFVRPFWLRLVVAVLFASPAAVAGYAATYGIARHFMPSEGWKMAFTILGVIAVGTTVLFRMAGAAPSEPSVERASRA